MAARSRETGARGKARVVVIGGGYAGVLAALRVAGKARRRGIPVEVTLVNGAPVFVERVRLHEQAAGRKPARLPLARLLRGRDIALVVGWVRRIDAGARALEVEVEADAGGRAARSLPYDALVYAAGSTAAPEVVPGGEAHAFTLAEAAGARALQDRLAAARAGERVLVIGGGLTAIEAATEIAEAFPHLAVTLASRGQVGSGLSEAGRAYLARAFRELGVGVRERVRALEVREGGAVLAPEAGGAAPALLAAEIVVLAAGLRASGLAAASGLATTADGRLVVDEHLRAPAHPEIWGAGDGAAAPGGDGAPLRMSCAAAMPQGAYVADAIVAELAGDPVPPFRFSFAAQCLSLGRDRGLLQRVDALDRPHDRVWTGRVGAWVKEAICRGTVLALRLERVRPGSYWWPGARQAPERWAAAAASVA